VLNATRVEDLRSKKICADPPGRSTKSDPNHAYTLMDGSLFAVVFALLYITTLSLPHTLSSIRFPSHMQSLSHINVSINAFVIDWIEIFQPNIYLTRHLTLSCLRPNQPSVVCSDSDRHYLTRTQLPAVEAIGRTSCSICAAHIASSLPSS
jgi:hypothetical protein